MKLDEEAHYALEELEELEVMEDSVFAEIHSRTMTLLQDLMASGYVVASARPGRVKITEAGRQALRDHRGSV